MRPERFWAQSCAERKKNAIRKDMIRERDNATKDYDCGDRDSPWKADGETECSINPGMKGYHSLTFAP